MPFKAHEQDNRKMMTNRANSKDPLQSPMDQLHFQARLVFAMGLVAIMIAFSLKDGGRSIVVLPPGTCNIDYTFEFFDRINTATRTHIWLKDAIVIFNNFCIDVTLWSLFLVYFMGILKSNTGFLALTICTVAKQMMQDHFFVFE